jgi:hypothetical protein
VVFYENQPVDRVIFVKKGKLRIDKEIALDHTNYWPIGYKHWEVNITKTSKVRSIAYIT